MRKLLRWLVWYDDGQHYSGETQDQWNALPQEGVLWMQLQFDDGAVTNYNGQDLYWQLDGVIANDNDREGILRRLPFVKFGRWTTNEKFDEVTAAAELAAVKHRADFFSTDRLGGDLPCGDCL